MLNRLLFFSFILLCGCGLPDKSFVINPSENEISGMTASNVLYPYETVYPRYDMIRDAAMIYAAQCALHHYTTIIYQQLNNKKDLLDRAFNFQPLILDHDVVPPVVGQSDKTIDLVDKRHIVVADRSYQILKHGFFTTVPVTWRDYLITQLHPPGPPEKSMLPTNSVEREIWQRYVAEGWIIGKEQAFEMFKNNLYKLQQDYLGMVTFHRLFQQGLMTAPIIQEIDNGIIMDKERMNINHKILSIAEQAFLDSNTSRWHSYIYLLDQ
jgi:defect-in-organelle-trafficking protein DotC